MLGRNLSVRKIMLALAVLLLGADPAMAYVGPGADVTFISSALTLLLWVLAAFSATLLWPVYALWRRIRGCQNKSTRTSSLEKAREEACGVSRTSS